MSSTTASSASASIVTTDRAEITQKPKPSGKYRQFPIRLNHAMWTGIDEMSNKTNISKTIITRMALKIVLKNWIKTGHVNSIDNSDGLLK
jgi:hypothetical protein